jgi:CxxC motif-containing protein (DUF1111 family)
MKLPSWGWYLVVALVALVPVGIRALTWQGPRRHAVDAAMAQAGQALFTHEWTPNDPLCPGGDGLGPVFNANSCVACHQQGGLGGSGGLGSNVTTFTVRSSVPNEKPREGVVHARAVRYYQETLAQVHPSLPAISQPSLRDLGVPLDDRGSPSFQPPPRGVHLSQRNTPALFGAKLIDEIPDQAIIANEKAERLKSGLAPADRDEAPVGRALRLANGRVGRFGWKAQTASLGEFVRAACANELGLGNPGQAQPKPLGRPDYRAPGLDLTDQQCDQLTAYCLSLPPPVERVVPDSPAAREQATAGKALFHTVGCADCHTPDVGSVQGLYSDLLLHRMGQELEGGGSYNDPPTPLPDGSPGDGPSPAEWRTPPLWGVADSAPYLHDGRAATLEEAIQLHAGQGGPAAQRFAGLKPADKARLVAFLKTLRAP